MHLVKQFFLFPYSRNDAFVMATQHYVNCSFICRKQIKVQEVEGLMHQKGKN